MAIGPVVVEANEKGFLLRTTPESGAVLKSTGVFRWSKNLKGWFPRPSEGMSLRDAVDAGVDALTAAGFEVDVSVLDQVGSEGADVVDFDRLTALLDDAADVRALNRLSGRSKEPLVAVDEDEFGLSLRWLGGMDSPIGWDTVDSSIDSVVAGFAWADERGRWVPPQERQVEAVVDVVEELLRRHVPLEAAPLDALWKRAVEERGGIDAVVAAARDAEADAAADAYEEAFMRAAAAEDAKVGSETNPATVTAPTAPGPEAADVDAPSARTAAAPTGRRGTGLGAAVASAAATAGRPGQVVGQVGVGAAVLSGALGDDAADAARSVAAARAAVSAVAVEISKRSGDAVDDVVRVERTDRGLLVRTSREAGAVLKSTGEFRWSGAQKGWYPFRAETDEAKEAAVLDGVDRLREAGYVVDDTALQTPSERAVSEGAVDSAMNMVEAADIDVVEAAGVGAVADAVVETNDNGFVIRASEAAGEVLAATGSFGHSKKFGGWYPKRSAGFELAVTVAAGVQEMRAAGLVVDASVLDPAIDGLGEMSRLDVAGEDQLLLPGIPVELHELAFDEYVMCAQWSAPVVGPGEGEPSEDMMADGLRLTAAGRRALEMEAAAVWGALPEAVRDGIVASDAHIGAVFHSLQLSATGQGSGLANVAGLGDLGERADAALAGSIPQLRAEMDRSFVINGDGELDVVGWTPTTETTATAEMAVGSEEPDLDPEEAKALRTKWMAEIHGGEISRGLSAALGGEFQVVADTESGVRICDGDGTVVSSFDPETATLSGLGRLAVERGVRPMVPERSADLAKRASRIAELVGCPVREWPGLDRDAVTRSFQWLADTSRDGLAVSDQVPVDELGGAAAAEGLSGFQRALEPSVARRRAQVAQRPPRSELGVAERPRVAASM